jgi:hypothetical protein
MWLRDGRSETVRISARRTHGLFFPNDGDQGMWLTWVGEGSQRKVAVDLHSAINFPQLLATAIERENVPSCVRAKLLGWGGAGLGGTSTLQP